MKKSVALALLVAGVCLQSPLAAQQAKPAASPMSPSQPFLRDPKIPIDDEYTKKIKEYTTEPFFSSPLVDYLPASKTVPTPKAVLGDVAGAPGKLPYAEEVYQYMRMLEKAAPGRVKVVSIGKTEEGREMIAVAIASDAIMAKLDENRARLAKLGDPRTINMDDAQAETLVGASTPIYYITGTIHSPETGAPTALMELAYRLVVDDHEYIKSIRNNLITLITPVIEVDGRDKMVDVYKWHLAHPGQNYPGLVYWGKYVAHDNNRDAMGATLKLTENVLNTWMQWHPQVLHDLHESVPYLYDNTVGDGPYNAWIDPILADEWEMIGWNNVVGDDQVRHARRLHARQLRHLVARLPDVHRRAAQRHQPPLRNVRQRRRRHRRARAAARRVRAHLVQAEPAAAEDDVVAAQQQQLRTDRAAHLAPLFRRQRQAVPPQLLPEEQALDPQGQDRRGRPRTCWPPTIRVPARRRSCCKVLQKQGVEISRATAEFTVTVPGQARSRAAEHDDDRWVGWASAIGWAERRAGGQQGQPRQEGQDGQEGRDRNTPPAPVSRTFPAGSYIVRMDQPYSRIADSLMDYQYWSPNDPQKTPYDDTGWTFPELFNVQAVRVADVKVLDAPVEKMCRTDSRQRRHDEHVAPCTLVNHNADIALATLRYKFKDASFEAAEEPFDAAGKKFNRGSFIIKNASAGDLEKAADRSRPADRRGQLPRRR